MKKLELIVIIFFLGFGISLSSQPDTLSDLKDSTVVQSLDTISETNEFKDLINRLVETAVNTKIKDLNLESDSPPLDDKDFIKTLVFLIIVLPLLVTCAAVFLIVFFVLKHRKELEKLRYEFYIKSLEAGQQLPDKFFEKPIKKPSSNLKNGIIGLAGGLGGIILGLLGRDNTLIVPTTILLCLGIAFLLLYFIERKHNNEE